MIPSSCRPLAAVLVLFVIVVSATAQQDEPGIVTVSATVGGPSTFVISGKAGPGERAVSSSLVIQNTLLPALLSGAKPVQLDMEPGTNVIKRVNPFMLGKDPPPLFYGDYNVSRVATQRKPDGTGEHLEVFLKKINGSDEKTYNVYDPFLQQLLIAAFRSADGGATKLLPVDVQFDGNEIVTVTLGMKFVNKSK
jgi:hypothetical protein